MGHPIHALEKWATGVAKAVDDRLEAAANKVVPWAGKTRWWMPLAVAVVMVAAGGAAISALEGNLRSMHVAGVPGMTLQPRFGNANLPLATHTWLMFWKPLANQYTNPRALTQAILLLDWFVFIPGYATVALVLLLREHHLSGPQAHCKPLFRWAAALTLLLVATDAALENPLQWVLVRHWWFLPPTSTMPRRQAFFDHVLPWVTGGKLVLAALVIVAVLVVLFSQAGRISPGSRRSFRLLRGQVGVAFLALVLFSVPIQLADVLLRLDLLRSLMLFLMGVLFGASTWAVGRLVIQDRLVRVHEIPGRKAVQLRFFLPLVLPLAAIAIVNALTGGNWKVPLVPLGIVLILWLLGIPQRGLEGATPAPGEGRTEGQPRRPAFGDPTKAGKSLPGVLAALGMFAAGVAAVRASMAAYVGHASVTYPLWAGILLLVGALLVVGVCEAILAEESEVELRAADPAEERRQRECRQRRFYAIATGYVAVVVGILVALQISDALWWGPAIGGTAVLLLFLSALTLVTGGLVLAAESWVATNDLPPAFQPLRLRAIPVFSLLTIWAVVATLVDHGEHWDVTLKPATGPITALSLQDAFAAWEAKATQRAVTADRKSVPLVLVATSGGGIRSAFWTALTLDCVINGRKATEPTAHASPPDRCSGSGQRHPASPADIFLATGISGGSLGLVEWDAHTTETVTASTVTTTDNWVQERLGKDFVAPTVAQGLFVEVARGFLGYKAPGRAEVLERAWEQPWQDGATNTMTAGFLASQTATATNSNGPLLMLDGSSVFDGCALNTSILDVGSTIPQVTSNSIPTTTSTGDKIPLGDCLSAARSQLRRNYATSTAATAMDPGPLPATIDLLDYLACGDRRDLKRSTAALLSARFPFVSPSGRIPGCVNGVPTTKFILDGGIVDDSGAESSMAVWSAIEPLVRQRNADTAKPPIVPYFLQVDNDYLPATSPPDKTKSPNQLLAPLQALLQTTGLNSRAARARALAADIFSLPFPTRLGGVCSRYMRIVAQGHPGIEAPLGWTLASGSQNDLKQQLYNGNQEAINVVRGWFTADAVTCP